MAAPELQSVGATYDRSYGDVLMDGNLNDGFILPTDGLAASEYRIQFTPGTTSSEILKDEKFPFFLVSSSVSVQDLWTYYNDSDVSDPFLTYLKDAANGTQPFVFIDGSNVDLVDGARWSLLSVVDDMVIPGDYPQGIYAVQGEIEGTDNQTAVVNLTLNITGVFLPEVVINEFVVDPQTDWSGSGGINSNDEWFELYNKEAAVVDITGWTLSMGDGSDAVEVLITSLAPGEHYVILNPDGQQGDDGQIQLYNEIGLLVDSVSYGDWDDGDESDNAPNGKSLDIYDECIARLPDGIDTGVDEDDFIKTVCTYGGENDFALVPISITNLPANPACIFETDDLTVSANITGSIRHVTLSLNTNGVWANITLPGNEEGIYHYIIDSSEFNGSSDISWQFIVEDVSGNLTFGGVVGQHINGRTVLVVDPVDPDGFDGWYVSEPTFTLINPDAATINYRWNGYYYVYVGPFGLEGTPNDGNVTGGVHVLRYWSDICGGEGDQEFTESFDLTPPSIEDIVPEDGEVIYGDLVISALLDDIYQSNSGIDEETIEMFIDGSPVGFMVTTINDIKSYIEFGGGESLSDGIHEVVVQVLDNAGWGSQLTWYFELNLSSQLFDMEVYFPQDSVHDGRKVPFNITTTKAVEILELINYNDPTPRFRTLCRNCDSYGFDRIKTRSLREGENNLTIRATDEFANSVEKNVSIIVDSRDPRITKTEPRRGLASGLLKVVFREKNPESLFLYYGNASDFRLADIGFGSCVENRNNVECEALVDLTNFHGDDLVYWFNLTDIVSNSYASKANTVEVDTQIPVVDYFDYVIDGRIVEFIFNVTEENFDEITYIDFEEKNPRERILCTRLRDGICERRKSFSRGDHNLTIWVLDEAGNSKLVIENLVFNL